MTLNTVVSLLSWGATVISRKSVRHKPSKSMPQIGIAFNGPPAACSVSTANPSHLQFPPQLVFRVRSGISVSDLLCEARGTRHESSRRSCAHIHTHDASRDVHNTHFDTRADSTDIPQHRRRRKEASEWGYEHGGGRMKNLRR